MSSSQPGPDRLSVLLVEHAALEQELADPAVHADQARARRLGRRYAQLAPLVETARALADLSGAPPAASAKPPMENASDDPAPSSRPA